MRMWEVVAVVGVRIENGNIAHMCVVCVCMQSLSNPFFGCGERNCVCVCVYVFIAPTGVWSLGILQAQLLQHRFAFVRGEMGSKS